MIQVTVRSLIETLERLNDLHVDMLEIGERKKQAIIRNDIDELTKTMQQESKKLKQITEAEAQRQEAVYAFLREKGIKSNLNLTITELLRLVFHPDEKKALTEAQQSLGDTLQRMKRLNAHNQELIEQSLSFVTFSLDVMIGGPEDEAVYHNPTGQAPVVNRSGWLDTRA